jgi:hypothetical protein
MCIYYLGRAGRVGMAHFKNFKMTNVVLEKLIFKIRGDK